MDEMRAKTVVLSISIPLALLGLGLLTIPPYSAPDGLWGAHRLQLGYGSITIAVSLFVVEQIVRRAVDREVGDQLRLQLRERSALPLEKLRENASELSSIALKGIQIAYPSYDDAMEATIGQLVQSAPNPYLVELASVLEARGHRTANTNDERAELHDALAKIIDTRADLLHVLLHANQFLDRTHAVDLKIRMSMEKIGYLQLASSLSRLGRSGRFPGHVVDAFASYHVVCSKLANYCAELTTATN